MSPPPPPDPEVLAVVVWVAVVAVVAVVAPLGSVSVVQAAAPASDTTTSPAWKSWDAVAMWRDYLTGPAIARDAKQMLARRGPTTQAGPRAGRHHRDHDRPESRSCERRPSIGDRAAAVPDTRAHDAAETPEPGVWSPESAQRERGGRDALRQAIDGGDGAGSGVVRSRCHRRSIAREALSAPKERPCQLAQAISCASSWASRSSVSSRIAACRLATRSE
mgnify:CR=1 FL=1